MLYWNTEMIMQKVSIFCEYIGWVYVIVNYEKKNETKEWRQERKRNGVCFLWLWVIRKERNVGNIPEDKREHITYFRLIFF